MADEVGRRCWGSTVLVAWELGFADCFLLAGFFSADLVFFELNISS